MPAPLVCEAWGYDAGQPFDELEEGTVWHLKDDDVVLKRRNSVSDAGFAKLNFEQKVRRRLAPTLPVVPFIPTTDSDFVASDGEHYFEASNYVPSEPLPTDESRGEVLAEVGATIARMHLELAKVPAGLHPPNLRQNDLIQEVLVTGIPKVKQFLTGQSHNLFTNAVSAVEGRLASCYRKLGRQLIHRDCHAGNFLLHDGKIVGIIDWDQLSLGPAILDLAYYAVQLMKWHVADKAFMHGYGNDWQQLKAGYQAVRPFSSRERESLKPMLLTIPLLFAPWCLDNGLDEYVEMEIQAFQWLLDET